MNDYEKFGESNRNQNMIRNMSKAQNDIVNANKSFEEANQEESDFQARIAEMEA